MALFFQLWVLQTGADAGLAFLPWLLSRAISVVVFDVGATLFGCGWAAAGAPPMGPAAAVARGCRIVDGLAAFLALALALLQLLISASFGRPGLSYVVCAVPIAAAGGVQAVAIAAVAGLYAAGLGGPAWARLVDDPAAAAGAGARHPRWRLFTARFGPRAAGLAATLTALPLAVKLDDPASPRLSWTAVLVPGYVALALAGALLGGLAVGVAAEAVVGAAAEVPPLLLRRPGGGGAIATTADVDADDGGLAAAYAQTRAAVGRTAVAGGALCLAAVGISVAAARRVLGGLDVYYAEWRSAYAPVARQPGVRPLQAPPPSLTPAQAGAILLPLLVATAVGALFGWLLWGALLPRWREVRARAWGCPTPTGWMAARMLAAAAVTTGAGRGGGSGAQRLLLGGAAVGPPPPPPLPPPSALVKVAYHRYRRLAPGDAPGELSKAPPPPLFTPVASAAAAAGVGRSRAGGRGRSALSRCLSGDGVAAGGGSEWAAETPVPTAAAPPPAPVHPPPAPVHPPPPPASANAPAAIAATSAHVGFASPQCRRGVGGSASLRKAVSDEPPRCGALLLPAVETAAAPPPPLRAYALAPPAPLRVDTSAGGPTTPPAPAAPAPAAALPTPPPTAAPPPLPSPSAVEAANTCAVCTAAPPDGVLLECGHGGLCVGCCRRLAKAAHLPPGGRCPFCRAPISHVVRLVALPGAHTARLVDVAVPAEAPPPVAVVVHPPLPAAAGGAGVARLRSPPSPRHVILRRRRNLHEGGGRRRAAAVGLQLPPPPPPPAAGGAPLVAAAASLELVPLPAASAAAVVAVADATA